MSSYRYRFVGYEKLPSGMNADDVQLRRLPDELIRKLGTVATRSATTWDWPCSCRSSR